MNHIGQITNFSDIITSASTRPMEVMTPKTENPNEFTRFYVKYAIIPAENLTGSSSIPLTRIGYVCEPRGIDYPIYITTDSVDRKIAIGKTGMYETMPETFLDMNDDYAEELDCTPKITKIMLPIKRLDGKDDKTIKFVLDYVYAAD